MEISLEIIATAFIAVIGYILGRLDKHGKAIQQRVTHEECTQRQDRCPCHERVKALEQLVGKVDERTRGSIQVNCK